MSDVLSRTAVYGAPPVDLVDLPAGALQVSPLKPGAGALEDCTEASLTSLTMLAPPGTLERRYELALGLRALEPGGVLTALAPKDKGGARLRKTLEGFGCDVEETSKRHHRLCTCPRPVSLTGIVEALSEGALRLIPALSLWSQPGVFSWDRIDPGSALLAQTLPELSGRGADLGCGIGYLARAVLASAGVERLTLIDIDRRAVEAAGRNVGDVRADLHWADVTAPDLDIPAHGLDELDFLVMNPPFHDAGAEDRTLGQAFIQRAARSLRKGGALWLVANRHLPYEALLASLFAAVKVKAAQGGYKVLEARR